LIGLALEDIKKTWQMSDELAFDNRKKSYSELILENRKQSGFKPTETSDRNKREIEELLKGFFFSCLTLFKIFIFKLSLYT
jgi:hypothetical protein